ncbi:MAG: hypothetical protein R3Y68_01580 [Rikenellaceae bacterium]
MKCRVSVAVLSLFVAPFVVGQVKMARVSESGDSLRIRRAVELTTDGVKTLQIKGDVMEAYHLFEEAIHSDSTYAPAKFAMADLLMQSQPKEATKYAAEAYASDTTNYWYLSRYAQAVVSSGDYALARNLYEKTIAMRPLDINAYRILAILYQQESRVLEAISLLDTAEMRGGRNPYLTSLKQQMLLSTNQKERAIEEAVAAVEEAPFVADNRLSLAQLYIDLRRDSLAQIELDAALAIDSTKIETLLAVANFHLSRGRDREYLRALVPIAQSPNMDLTNKLGIVKEVTARRDLYRRDRIAVGSVVNALTLAHPNEPEVVAIQAKHLITQGYSEEALRYFKHHLDDEPAQLDYYSAIVDIERYLGRMDSVELYLTRAVERFPGEGWMNFEMANMMVAKGHYDEAVEYYKSTLEGATDSLQSLVWSTVGDILYQKLNAEIASDSTAKPSVRVVRRRLKEVYSSYDRAIELFDDNILALNNYAYFLCENGGDLALALSMAERAVEVQSSNATFIDTYGWILYRLGRYEDAKLVMRRAISFNSTNNYEIALHYAEILAALGETTMSEFYWEKAAQWGASDGEIEQSRTRVAAIVKDDDK